MQQRGIQLEAIRKSFGATPVLKGISLDLRPGEFLSLVGPSGCGKTTLLRIIAGLEEADAGQVRIDGRDVTGLRPADRDIAMVFQNYALYPHLTVAENLAVPLVMRRMTAWQHLPLVGRLLPGSRARRAWVAARVRDAAESLRIGHLLDRRPAQLSGGQQQRVALGRAIVAEAPVCLMDEPLSNLDAQLRVEMRREIRALQRRLGLTMLYVTHDQVEAMTMSDRVAVMMAGELLQLGTPREVYEQPADLRVAGFLGSPRINALAAVAGEGRMMLGPLALPLATAAAPGTPLTLALRPEALRLGGPRGLPARVEHLEFLGAELLLHARLEADGAAVIARLGLAEAAGLGIGQPVTLAPDWAAALVFDAAGRRLGVASRQDMPAHA